MTVFIFLKVVLFQDLTNELIERIVTFVVFNMKLFILFTDHFKTRNRKLTNDSLRVPAACRVRAGETERGKRPPERGEAAVFAGYVSPDI